MIQIMHQFDANCIEFQRYFKAHLQQFSEPSDYHYIATQPKSAIN